MYSLRIVILVGVYGLSWFFPFRVFHDNLLSHCLCLVCFFCFGYFLHSFVLVNWLWLASFTTHSSWDRFFDFLNEEMCCQRNHFILDNTLYCHLLSNTQHHHYKHLVTCTWNPHHKATSIFNEFRVEITRVHHDYAIMLSNNWPHTMFLYK